MTVAELLVQFQQLSSSDRIEFLSKAANLQEISGRMLQPGTKVKFVHSRTGAVIFGTFNRMKQKYAEVTSMQNQYGAIGAMPVRWSVSPQQLQVVPEKTA